MNPRKLSERLAAREGRERRMSDIDSQDGGSSADSAEIVDPRDEEWEWGDDDEPPPATRYVLHSCQSSVASRRLFDRE